MLKHFTLSFLLLFTVLIYAQNSSAENATDLSGSVLVQYPSGWQFNNPLSGLFTSGPHFNVPGGGAGGANLSSLQSNLSMTSFGFAHQSGFRVADDFTIPDGQSWNISSVELYAYQTGSTTTSTITGVNVRIWSGTPGTGTIVFGDTTTNRMASTSFANVYRALDTQPTNTQRPLMRQVVTLGVTLPAGTYWIDWQTTGSLTSGPWVPPIVITGNATTGNGRQFSSSTGQWTNINDGGSNTPQGLPFTLNGTVIPTGSPNCVKIIHNDDIVKLFSTSPYSSGIYSISFFFTIPANKAGYFNTLAVFAGNNSNWGMEVYFDANGQGRCFGGSPTPSTFTWQSNRWNYVENIVNLNTNQAQFYFNGNLIRQWQWTLGANGTAIPQQLHALNLYGATANDEMYVDLVKITNLSTGATIFADDFGTYTAGQLLVCQAPNVWITWTPNQACGPEDAEVSAAFNYIPVELTSFVANISNSAVELNWVTATELNNYGFEVQRRSIDGDFYTIGFVRGNGTTTETKNYSFLDNNVQKGLYYYRLKQIDFSGDFEYSTEIEVDFNPVVQFALEQNYPNPFNPVTNIKFSLIENSNVKLTVYNLLGEVIKTLIDKPMNIGYHQVEFDASGLPSGIYFYKLQAGKNTLSKKMILMK